MAVVRKTALVEVVVVVIVMVIEEGVEVSVVVVVIAEAIVVVAVVVAVVRGNRCEGGDSWGTDEDCMAWVMVMGSHG